MGRRNSNPTKEAKPGSRKQSAEAVHQAEEWSRASCERVAIGKHHQTPQFAASDGAVAQAAPALGLQTAPGPRGRIAPDQVDKLIKVLAGRGYEVLGPAIRDGAIVYEDISGIADMPQGWTDEQEPGRYRLKQRAGKALFGYSTGPQSWKRYLHPAEVKLFEADQKDKVFTVLKGPSKPERPLAFIGVRACELAAIGIQDRVLLNDKYRDPIYAARREGAFIAAVQCTQAAQTCFCESMGTGPRVTQGADLVLTEVADGEDHWLIAEAIGERGNQVLAELETQPVTQQEHNAAEAAVDRASSGQSRRIETNGLKELLYRNFDHPRWDDVARRCLTCANCTMVCPTCFCTNVEDVSDVSGDHAERWRRWDSCFTINFSYIHGGSIRASAKARYRQWMTHKLASWIDQFGTSGCVGCGRCITWCPVGIDITEEAGALCGTVNHGKTHT